MAEQKFAASLLGHVDSILNEMRDGIKSSHPLAGMMHESIMLFREFTCCYARSAGHLHNVALESTTKRLYSIEHQLDHHTAKVAPPLQGELHKMSAAIGGGYQKRYFSIRRGHLRFHHGPDHDPNKCLDLNAPFTLIEKNSSGDPVFELDHEDKLYQFKANDDATRCQWLQALNSYAESQRVYKYFDKLDIKAKIKMFQDEVFNRDSQEEQYILARLPSGERHDPRGIMDVGEPFDVEIPVTLGKNKPRIMKFDLKSQPYTLIVYKTGDSQPYISLERNQLLDFSLSKSGKGIDISLRIQRDKKVNSKVFRFPYPDELDRFTEVLGAFRRVNSGFLFLFDDWLFSLPLKAMDKKKMLKHGSSRAITASALGRSRTGTPNMRSSVSVNSSSSASVSRISAPQSSAEPIAEKPKEPDVPAIKDCEWYYLKPGSDVPNGPVKRDELRAAYRRGETNASCKIWESSMGDWTKIEALPDIQKWLQPVEAAPADRKSVV